MTQKKKQTNMIPFRGGVITGQELSLIPSGGYSAIQNMRMKHPGFSKRAGCRKLHTTADSTNEVLSLFQYSKGRVSERHFYAQMSDGDVLEATTAPPGVTTGAFGSEVHDGTASGMVPASWSVIDDIMAYSNGSNQHQLYPGTDPYVKKVVVFVSAAAIPTIPDIGSDYTEQATDGLSTTVVVMDSLGTLAQYDCVFIMTDIPATSINFTFSAPNGTASDSQMHYWNGAWAEVTSLNDATELLTLDTAPGTAWTVGDTITGQTSNKSCVIVAITTTLTYQVSGRTGAFTLGEVLTNGTYTADQGAAHPQIATLGYSGSMGWTAPTDEIPHYMFDDCGFWYRLSLASGALDAEVELTSVQYNTVFKALQNVWDGVTLEPVEVKVYDQSATTYYSYAASKVTVNSATASDIIYFNSADPIVGFYVDVGKLPNVTATTTINAVNFFNGAAFAAVSNLYDGTDGLSKSGWVTFSRQATVQPCQFNDSRYYSYWYSFTVDKTLSASVSFSIEVMPYFNVADFGSVGLSNCAWKDRMLYVFTRFPNDIIVSAKHRPMVLNGADFTILDRPGDGRSNKVVNMKKIYNELLVWQEERGVEGGCLTLYQGYSPETFGKLVLSTRYGTFNAKSAVVVDGIRMNINKVEDPPVSVAFFLSHAGVFMCDGKTVECISEQPNSSIQNYFDPTDTTCIRDGYESKMWLSYDPVYNCIRIGLVSGTTATLPNVFPVYDIQDRAWSFDSLAQEFSCLVNVEAASGYVTAIQCAGGIDDGQVYQSNYGTDDISTAIDAFATMEVDSDGAYFNLDEITLRMKVQSAGNCTLTPSLNGVAQTAKTLSMTAEATNQVSRRHLIPLNLISDHVSLKFQNATAAQNIFLKDVGVGIKDYDGQ
jgi:hypothetical protein